MLLHRTLQFPRVIRSSSQFLWYTMSVLEAGCGVTEEEENLYHKGSMQLKTIRCSWEQQLRETYGKYFQSKLKQRKVEVCAIRNTKLKIYQTCIISALINRQVDKNMISVFEIEISRSGIIFVKINSCVSCIMLLAECENHICVGLEEYDSKDSGGWDAWKTR